MKSVRLGIIGLSNMGLGRAENIESGKVSRCELAAGCGPAPEKLTRKRISTSRFNKNTVRTPSVVVNNFAKSFNR